MLNNHIDKANVEKKWKQERWRHGFESGEMTWGFKVIWTDWEKKRCRHFLRFKKEIKNCSIMIFTENYIQILLTSNPILLTLN